MQPGNRDVSATYFWEKTKKLNNLFYSWYTKEKTKMAMIEIDHKQAQKRVNNLWKKNLTWHNRVLLEKAVRRVWNLWHNLECAIDDLEYELDDLEWQTCEDKE